VIPPDTGGVDGSAGIAVNDAGGSALDGSSIVEAGSTKPRALGEALYTGFTNWNDFQIGTCDQIRTSDHPPFKAIQTLATSNQEVRVLVYGQSLSVGPWVDQVRAWLKATYPNGNLRLETHANPGCSSQCLDGHDPWVPPAGDNSQLNRLPKDVFSFKPDLIIFHVFGSHTDYAQIMTAFKDGCAPFATETGPAKCVPGVDDTGYTTPEVLIQNDPRTATGNYPHPDHTLPDNPPIPDGEWNHWMTAKFIPRTIAPLGYKLADDWKEWEAFLDKTKVPVTDLENTPGDVHFSANGHKLMARSVAQHLCYP
jgi:hypothetical protein